ncbi:DUF4168 domain-containing protein [Bordetella genomosp. 13]|uniref:DUF4168 domain-containing protein n=1 Tax=Bordetella genomosp. 13 TaxID=463040 RepID=UPI0011A84A62|nr:DUF4168 domain-containing protein [Bordetella genomosp. 13]
MQRTTQALLSAAILAAGLTVAPAMAQGSAATPSQQPQQPAAVQPSEAQLQKFASASQKVAMVADEYRPRVQAASDDSSRQQLLKEADQKMVRTVNADGMTVDEFNGISQAIQQDPQLQQRVMGMVQQQQGGAR